MNRLLSTIILGIAAANAALAGPQISWLAESHDFGIFNEDAGEQTCSFSFVGSLLLRACKCLEIRFFQSQN